MFRLFKAAVNDPASNIAFILSDKTSVTYKEADTIVDGWAQYLYELGVRQGDRLAVLTEQEDLYPFIHLALDKLNATIVPLDTETPSEELKHLSFVEKILIDARRSQVPVHKNLTVIPLTSRNIYPPQSLKVSLPDIERDTSVPSYIVASSGTTGRKKWIPILSAGLEYWARIEKSLLGLTADNKILCTRSPAYDARISEYVRALAAGSTLVLLSQADRRNLHAIVEQCELERITCLILIASQLNVPDQEALIHRLAKAGLKHLMVTGDACTLNLKRCCEKYKIFLWNCYGPTEATFGMSIKCVNLLKVFNESGQEIVPVGLPNSKEVQYHLIDGCLYIESSQNLSPGYINDTERTLKNFPTLMINGRKVRVFNTENKFTLRDNYLIFQGRIDHDAHCKVSGVKVEPYAIQQCLEQYNQEIGKEIFQAFVVIKPWQEVVKPIAYLKIHGELNTEHFIQYLKARLRPEETPILLCLKEFPRLSTSEKIDRCALIEREDNSGELLLNAPQKQDLMHDALLDRLQTIWAEILGIPYSNYDQDFIFLGGDSLKLTTLFLKIKKDVCPEYTFQELIQLPQLTLTELRNSLLHRNVIQSRNALWHFLSGHLNEERAICFFLPPLLGEAKFTYLFLKDIYKKYHKNFKICALSEPSIHDASLLPKTLEEEVARFVGTILSVQAEGPYHLLGFSFGATLAYCVARALMDAGKVVKTLELVDGLPPAAYQNLPAKHHAPLLEELANFMIQTLNNRYFNEQLKPIRLVSFKKLSVTEQINTAFDAMDLKIKNDQSRPVAQLARRHLLFIHQHTLEPTKISVTANLYFSNRQQTYLAILDKIPPKILPPECRKFGGWNRYFSETKGCNWDAPTDHLGLLQKSPQSHCALSDFWSRSVKINTFPILRKFSPVFTLNTGENGDLLHCKVYGIGHTTLLQYIEGNNLAVLNKHYALFEQIAAFYDEAQICSTKFCQTFIFPPAFRDNLLVFFREKSIQRVKNEGSICSPIYQKKIEQAFYISLLIFWNARPLLELLFTCHGQPKLLLSSFPDEIANLEFNANPEQGMYRYRKSYVDVQNPGISQAMQVVQPLLNQFAMLLDPYVSPGFKYQNNKRGVSSDIQEQMDTLAACIQSGQMSNVQTEQQMQMDLLILHANHLDQQTLGIQMPLSERRKKILSWMDAAYTLAKKYVPDLETWICEHRLTEFRQLKPRILSSISLLLHYLGKVRRYKTDSLPEERLLLLTIALAISKHLDTLKEEEKISDPHYYKERTLTFMNPVWITLEQMGRRKEAENIIKEQLSEAHRQDSDFHIILSHTNLSEFNRKKTEGTGIDAAISHAQTAIEHVLKTHDRSDRESFIHHNIYFNARLSAVKAWQAKAQWESDPCRAAGARQEAITRAKTIQREHLGAKAGQLEELDSILQQLQSSEKISSFSFFVKNSNRTDIKPFFATKFSVLSG